MTGLIVIRHTKLQKFTFYSFWRLVECAVCMQNKHSRKEFSSSSVQRRRTAASRWSCTNTSHNWTEYELRRYEEVRRWLQLWFDFDSTLVRRERRTAYQRSSSAKWRNRLAAASHAEVLNYLLTTRRSRTRTRSWHYGVECIRAVESQSNFSRTTVES